MHRGLEIVLTSVLSALFSTQSYLFLVSCTVLASFIQYVPTILAVVKFEHTNQYPTHGFKLPGKYLIPGLALLVSCYMVTNFTSKTLLLGTVILVLAQWLTSLLRETGNMKKKHEKWLKELQAEGQKLK